MARVRGLKTKKIDSSKNYLNDQPVVDSGYEPLPQALGVIKQRREFRVKLFIADFLNEMHYKRQLHKFSCEVLIAARN